jgi:hypothetical protein
MYGAELESEKIKCCVCTGITGYVEAACESIG